MKKKIIIISLIIGLVVFYLVFHNNLPPRTPYKIARIESGLNVKRDFEIEIFKDKFSKGKIGSVPSGSLLIKFDLTEKQHNKLYKEALNKGYDKIPIKETLIYKPDFLCNIKNGVYKLKNESRDPLDFSMILLCNETKKLIVFISDS